MLGSVQCLCRWCVVCVNHQSGANGDRAAFSLWNRRRAHWSLQTRLYKLGELQACSHSFQPSPEFPFVAQEKTEYHFCSSLRRCWDKPFLCLNINLAISSSPQQTKQRHRLAVLSNFVQEARAECSSISWFSLWLKRALLIPATLPVTILSRKIWYFSWDWVWVWWWSFRGSV